MKDTDTTDFLDKGYPDDYYLDSDYVDSDGHENESKASAMADHYYYGIDWAQTAPITENGQTIDRRDVNEDAQYFMENRTDDADHTADSRRTHSRAPRRRRQVLNKAELEHISENLEESIAVYEHNTVNSAAGHRIAAEHKNNAEYKNVEGLNNIKDKKDSENLNAGEDNESSINNRRKLKEDEHEKQNKKLDDRKNKVKSGKNNKSNKSKTNDSAEASNDISNDKSGISKKKRHPILRLILLLFLCTCAFVAYKFITGQNGYYTVAVFGVDSRNGNVGREALSDVNIIARIDRATGEVKLVSLYRDTYTKINSDGTYHKLNEAYFRGGPEQAIWAVEHNTDVDIDDYATFNWKAVVDTINILGGVDLEITDSEFAYINAFITETVNSTGVGSHQLEHSGMNHLDGVQAVAYARLRLMDTDYQRTERQRKVIGLALEKAKAADYQTLLNIVTTVMPEISTSVTPDDLIPFARGIDRYYISETTGFPMDRAGQNVGKLDCVIPVTLESNAIKLHEFLYPDTPYTPSSGLKSISDDIINKTGLTG